MTKKLKIVSVICVMCICSTFLSSCQYIDDLRSKRVVFVDDGGVKKIEKNGKIYVELEGMGDFFGVGSFERIMLTEKDVPILLSGQFGYSAWYSDRADLFELDGEIYCPEDKHDFYIEQSIGGVFDRIGHYGYDPITLLSKRVEFTDSEKELIFDIWNDESVKKSIFEADWNKFTTTIKIKPQSSQYYIYCEYEVYLVRDASGDKLGLVVRREDDKKYGQYHKYILYTVPNEKKEEFRNIIDKYDGMLLESGIVH